MAENRLKFYTKLKHIHLSDNDLVPNDVDRTFSVIFNSMLPKTKIAIDVDDSKVNLLSVLPSKGLLSIEKGATNVMSMEFTSDEGYGSYVLTYDDDATPKVTGLDTSVEGIRQAVLDNTEKIQNLAGYGAKSNRPITLSEYPLYFDEGLKKRIEWAGYRWQTFDGKPADLVEISDSNIYAYSETYAPQVLNGAGETVLQTGINMTKDLILYSKLKLNDADDYFNIQFNEGSNLQFTISFGYDWVGGTKDGSSISIRDYINSENTLLGSLDMYTASHEVIIWYDHKWGYINVYIDDVLIGSWKSQVGGADTAGVTKILGKAGSTTDSATLDYWYMGIPLAMAIGDSITAGATLHAPNPDHYAGLDDYSSSYSHYISDTLKANEIKNYFVVNKGVNGDTTEQMNTRFNADIVASTPKYVFIHGGINDHSTHHDETISLVNKKSMADLALTNNITPVILGVLPTKNPSVMEAWQFAIDLNAAELTGYYGYNYINLWKAIEGATANTADDSKLADVVHPNTTGYIAIADEISEYLIF